jgi:DNA (cytosine-5)-methyltransferase 1
MYYLDLFHGIGGFALGAYWAGMKFKNHYCSDIEPYAVKLYKKRFPDSIQLGDITKIKSEDLPKGDWILTGGFPCQDISIAGKGKGLIDENGEKTRSGLWFEYWRLIRDLRPRFAIMENVAALTFRGLTDVLGSLAEIGYNAEWQDIRASDMGAPHRRERIWIVAYPDGGRCYRWNRTQQKSGRNESKNESIKKLADTGCKLRKKGNSTNFQGGAFWTVTHIHNKSGSKRPYWESWKAEPSVDRMVNGVSNQVDRLKGLGNSIVPQIAEVLFNQLIKKVIDTI